MQTARAAGYTGDDLQEASRFAWDVEPTDSMGHALTILGRAGLIRPPGDPNERGTSTQYQPYSAMNRSRQRRRAYQDNT